MSSEVKAGLITVRGEAVPLKGVEIVGEVSGALARVRLIQRYRNEESRAIEAVYTFPLPSDATLVGFSLACAGRRVESVVREREEAFREYEQAISSGHGGALVDQERVNVFTAQVGNLLPREDTVVELEYLQRVSVDEGTLRWMIPTLVAPRYIPGTPIGYRTGHGRAEPTDRAPDADLITPPVGAPEYRLRMNLLFDLGDGAQVESPSHAIQVSRSDGRLRVSFEQAEVALDRDIVLRVRSATSGELSAAACHRENGKPGVFSVTVLPDLFEGAAANRSQDVLFLLDTSGSMAGASIGEARAALRLCLRQLREGDRFNAIAFNNGQRKFSAEPVPFTQKTLSKADRWIDSLAATGGTELLPALMLALQSRPEVLMLLTDGQVGNESEILAAVARAGAATRIYCFGIGTNVSDALLRDLSRESSGAVELIHPGERIDDKVVSQFAKAIAPRVSDVAVTFEGVEVRELAPERALPLIDGEAWVMLGRYESPGRGALEIRGSLDGKPFFLKVPLELSESSSRPYLPKVWAAERIRDLEGARISGRRGDAIRKRILELALEHGIASPYTSLLAIEQREGDRLSTGQPQVRVVPVHAPAGWAMFEQKRDLRTLHAALAASIVNSQPALRAGASKRSAASAASWPRSTSSPVVPAIMEMAAAVGKSRLVAKAKSMIAGIPGRFAGADWSDAANAAAPATNPGGSILSRQLASGLWGDEDESAIARLEATVLALVELLDAGVTSSDARHGPLIRKAISALLELAAKEIEDVRWIELSLAVAWLCATGPRTRGEVDRALRARNAVHLPSRDRSEPAMRHRVDELLAELHPAAIQ